MANSWDYQPGFETVEEYRLFERWRQLGATHGAQRRLATLERRPVQEIDSLRARKLWNGRHAEWHEAVASAWVREVSTAADRYAKTVDTLQDAAERAAALVAVEAADLASAAERTGRGGALRPAEVIRALRDVVTSLEALRPPVETRASASADLSRLSVEDLATLARLQRKMRGDGD